MFSEVEDNKEPGQAKAQEPVNVVVELNCPMIWPSTQSEPEPDQATDEKQ